MATRKRKQQEKPARGRPKSDDPKMNTTLRLSRDLAEGLDKWAKENGDIGRSAAIRIAISKLLRE